MVKCVIEKLEDVPAAWREHYEPIVSGGFALQLIDGDAHPSVIAMKADLERVKAERREAKAELASANAKIAAFNRADLCREKLQQFDLEKDKFERDNADLLQDIADTQRKLDDLRQIEGERRETFQQGNVPARNALIEKLKREFGAPALVEGDDDD